MSDQEGFHPQMTHSSGSLYRVFAHAHQTHAGSWLLELDSRLSCHAWLFGDAPKLADMAVLPFVRQFAHTDLAWFDAQPWPHLKPWLRGWETGLLFRQVMEKYPPWQPGKPGIAFGPLAGLAPDLNL